MRSNDLRIGNLVKLYRKPTDKEMSVHQVKCVGDYVQIQDGFVVNVMSGIKPIPLTEEWLVKFGLYNNLKLNYNKRQGVEYRFRKKKLGTYIIKRYYNNSLYSMQFVYDDKHNNIPNEQIWVNIKHVHQLQNLYFALTGEELTIKE